MRLVSVNIGEERQIKRAKSSGKTGIYKIPAAGPVQVTELGIPNDAIVDTQNHGGYDQAVYLYGTDDYEWWSNELGIQLGPGVFGENLTIEGLISARIRAGDRFSIGDVMLEATAPRIPCVTLAARMNDPQFVKRFTAAERPGVYCRVIKPGYLQAGDDVRFTAYTSETVSLLEMFRYFYVKNPPVEYLRRHLAAPTPVKDRDVVEALLIKQLSA